MSTNGIAFKWVGIIAGISALVLLFRFAATFPYPVEWFGYDFGFYSYAVQHTPLDSIQYFLGLVHDYGNHLFVILNWIRLPQLPSLIILYYTFQAGSGIVLWLILRKHSQSAAWLGILLFSASVAQTQLHTMFLWKAAYGQLLLLTIFYFLERERWLWIAIASFLLLISHKTTSAIYVLVLAIYSLINFRHVRSTLVAVPISILVISVLLWYTGTVNLNELRSEVNPATSNGIFLDLQAYFRYTWLIFPVAIYGIVIKFRDKTSQLWLIMLGLSIFWIIATLPFYNRMLQYADLAIIYFAAIGTASLPWKQKQKITAVALIAIIAMAQYYSFNKTIVVEITQSEVVEIKRFASDHSGAFVLSLSALDAPWLLAYLHGNIRLAAPGLFEDSHSSEDWKHLRINPKAEQFFEGYPSPLYIYQRSSQPYPQGWQCLEQASEHFYQYLCH